MWGSWVQTCNYKTLYLTVGSRLYLAWGSALWPKSCAFKSLLNVALSIFFQRHKVGQKWKRGLSPLIFIVAVYMMNLITPSFLCWNNFHYVLLARHYIAWLYSSMRTERLLWDKMLCTGHNYAERLEIRLKYVCYLPLSSFNNFNKILTKKTSLKILDFSWRHCTSLSLF